jgi:hypothetical protein
VRFPALGKLYCVARGEVHADHAKQLLLMVIAPAIMASVWKITFDQFESVSAQESLNAHIEVLRRGVLKPTRQQPVDLLRTKNF